MWTKTAGDGVGDSQSWMQWVERPRPRFGDSWGGGVRGGKWVPAAGRCLTSIAPMTVVIPCTKEKDEKSFFKPSPSPVASMRWVPLTSRGSPTQMPYTGVAGKGNA